MRELAVKSTVSFDEFTVDSNKRTLYKNGETVNLNPKTFDLLLALIEKRGEIVSKDELLEMVWSGQFVEENNLTVNISLLRKVLGENTNEPRFIVTVPGNGYKFVADIEDEADEITIEHHSVERLIVNEEIEETTDLRNASIPTRNQRSSVFLYSIFGALAMFIIGAGSFWIYNVNKNDQDADQRSLNIRVYPTDEMIHRVNISPSGKLLAFVGRKKGLYSIWIGNVSTGNNIRITQPSDIVVIYISFDPNEEYIYIVARTERDNDWNLSRVSVFGGVIEELIKDVHSSVTFSPDGRKIVFLRREVEPGLSSLIFADSATGANEKVFLSFKNPQRFANSGLSWSPDGENITALITDENGKNNELTAINLADGTRKRIGTRFWSARTRVLWQKDGRALIAVRKDKSGYLGTSQIWSVSYPDGTERRITNDLNKYHPSSLGISKDGKIVSMRQRLDPQIWISPTIENPHDDVKVISSTKARLFGLYGLAIADDGKVIFTSNSGNSQSISEVNADGLDQKRLTPTKENSYDSQLVLTSDSRFLVFQSNRSGKNEIWRANRDGSDLKQITSGGGNGEPTVSPDGKWVIYTHYQDGLPTLWRISIDGGKAGKLSDEIASFPMISPDGNHIAARYGKLDFIYMPQIAIFPIKGGKPLKIIASPGAVLYNRLRWSPNEKAILYKNNQQGLWRHNIETEKREKVELMDDFRVSHFALSADGKKFVYAGGVEVSEIIIIESSQ